MIEFIVGIVLGVALTLVVGSFWVKTLEDDAPVEDSPKNRWLKLQNEGGKYVKIKDGKVKIKILK
jgi:hypothetical protein